MTAPPVAAARRLLGRLRALVEARCVVLEYHRVAVLERDRWDLAVHPARFAEHLEVLRRQAVPVPLAQLAEPGAGAPRRGVAVTFDDGYADNLHAAKPLLERHDVPATVFVVAGAVDAGREFWWDELERHVAALALGGAAPGDVLGVLGVLDASGASGELGPPAPAGAGGRDALYDALWERLRNAAPGARERALDALADAAGGGRAPRAAHRPLTPGEVAQLADGGLVRVGAHTSSHPRLAGLDRGAQRREIVESKAQLEALAGGPVPAFAYPFGRPGDYTDETVALVREAGFALACVNSAGAVAARTDRHRLPRMYVKNWTGEEFERRLAGWFRA